MGTTEGTLVAPRGATMSLQTAGTAQGILVAPRGATMSLQTAGTAQGALVAPRGATRSLQTTGTVWGVSEPYLALWFDDEPLGYQPALGPRVSLALAWKQRETTMGSDPAIFGFGPNWNFSWISYVAK